MRRSRIAILSAALGATLLLAHARPVHAIVPSGQTVPNPGNANLNSVVQLDTAAQTVGTGSIICSYVGANGDGFFVVLTADHVVSAPAPIADRIGFLNGNPAAAPNNNLLLGTIFHGGSTGKEDLAVASVDYGKAPDAFFNSVVGLKYTSITTGLTGTKFTSVGFGNTGTLNTDAMGNPTGYTETAGTSGTKRFQNNVVTGSTAGATHMGYTYTDVQWKLTFPGVAGSGFVFRGDSGGPLFTTDPTTIGRIDNVQTNTIFAVTTFGPVGNVPAGSTETDLLLTPQDVTWIQGDLAALGACPEPGQWALIVTGLGIAALAGRWSRATGNALRGRAA